jgi:hypothetical protein
VIHDHLNVWLLRPHVASFSLLPELLDDTDIRSGAEQLGQSWQPIKEHWRLHGSALYGSGGAFELLGAIRLVAANELVLIFEGGLLAIMAGGSRDFTVARMDFEVTWLTSTESPPKAHTSSKKQRHSYKPQIFFSRDWHDSGHRFATEAEAEAFVANLRATWIPQGFIKRDRVQVVKEPPNASLDWKTKQAERLPEAGVEPSSAGDHNDERAA